MMEVALPFAPGESPFRAKGLVILDALGYFDGQVPGGLPALYEALPGPVRDYYARGFLPSAMYDILPSLVVGRTAARLTGCRHLDLVRDSAARMARRHVETLFKRQLKVPCPQTVVLGLPGASMRYFDFDVAHARMLEPRRAETMHTGIPRLLADTFCASSLAYAPYVLEQAGAREPVVTVDAVARDGEKYGVETVSIRFLVSWS
jgi:hypothetical protein